MTDQDLITPPGLSDLFCPGCGYNLRGIESDRCPECGIEVDRAALAEPVIPWTRRAKIGRVRAFIKTVWLVTWHPASLARDAARPVSYRDAQLFRWIVVILLAIPACGWTYYGVREEGDRLLEIPNELWSWSAQIQPPPVYFDLVLAWIKGAIWWPIGMIVVLVSLLLWTGAPSYLFHPRQLHVLRQNRAVALSCYTCAPLTWLFPIFTVHFLLMFLGTMGEPVLRLLMLEDIDDALLPLSLIAIKYLSFAVVFAWFHSVLRTLSKLIEPSPLTLSVLSLALPIACALATASLVGFVPLIAGYIQLLVESYS